MAAGGTTLRRLALARIAQAQPRTSLGHFVREHRMRYSERRREDFPVEPGLLPQALEARGAFLLAWAFALQLCKAWQFLAYRARGRDGAAIIERGPIVDPKVHATALIAYALARAGFVGYAQRHRREPRTTIAREGDVVRFGLLTEAVPSAHPDGHGRVTATKTQHCAAAAVLHELASSRIGVGKARETLCRLDARKAWRLPDLDAEEKVECAGMYSNVRMNPTRPGGSHTRCA